MNIEELMELDRPMTPEEQAFFEQELLKKARELQVVVQEIYEQVASEEPELAEKLRAAAQSTLDNIEAGVALPTVEGPPREA